MSEVEAVPEVQVGMDVNPKVEIVASADQPVDRFVNPLSLTATFLSMVGTVPVNVRANEEFAKRLNKMPVSGLMTTLLEAVFGPSLFHCMGFVAELK